MSTRQIILDMLHSMDCISNAQAQAATGVCATSVKDALRKLRDEGAAMCVGAGYVSVWCLPCNAEMVQVDIARRSVLRRAASRAMDLERRRKDREIPHLVWGDGIPVQRIVPASQTTAPKVSVRCVWDLAA